MGRSIQWLLLGIPGIPAAVSLAIASSDESPFRSGVLNPTQLNESAGVKLRIWMEERRQETPDQFLH